MSEQENTKLVKSAYEAFQSGNIQGVLDRCTDNIEWVEEGPSDIIELSGKRTGKPGVAEFFSKLDESETFHEFSPKEFIAQGNKVVVLGFYKTTVKSTNRPCQSNWVHVFTIQGGKISHFHEYFDTAAAVEAYKK